MIIKKDNNRESPDFKPGDFPDQERFPTSLRNRFKKSLKQYEKIIPSFLMMLTLAASWQQANKYDNPDTIVVSRDGTGEFAPSTKPSDMSRLVMDYNKGNLHTLRKACTGRNSSSLHGSPTSPASVVKTVITLSSHGAIVMPTSRCLQVDSIQKPP